MFFFTYLSMCCFFSLFIHMFLYVCTPLFLFNVDTNLGEQIPVENRKRFPLSFSSNSKSNENGKGSDIRRSC